MKTVDWYFDFISPFSYLASARLGKLPADIELRARPILFAGLLAHWQTRGPAEIEPMRRFTYRHVAWLAARDGIPLTLPPQHPFNPLKLLRLCLASDAGVALAQRLFRFVWAEGRSADDPRAWQRLLDELGVDESVVSTVEVKSKLRDETERAIARGVFGVPSFIVDDEIFWGYDAMEFLGAYLDDPAVLRTPTMRTADTLPQGVRRER